MHTGDDTAFDWIWRDLDHLEAHRDEFLRPVDQILNELRPLAARERPQQIPAERVWLHADWELATIVGTSGLHTVPPDGSQSFWAYRRGRNVPSHLCLARREPTRWVCLWGWWETGAFVIHTMYPGRIAPREIHDPEIPLDELPAAIEFWRNHAIVTEEGQYSPGAPDRSAP